MKEPMTCPCCGEIIPVESINCPECGWDEDFAEWHEEYNEKKDSNSINFFHLTKRKNSTDWPLWIKIIALVLLVSPVYFLIDTTTAIIALVLILISYFGYKQWKNNKPFYQDYHVSNAYQELIDLAGGDRELAKRLVEYERQRDPDNKQIFWIKEAIIRLERDRG